MCSSDLTIRRRCGFLIALRILIMLTTPITKTFTPAMESRAAGLPTLTRLRHLRFGITSRRRIRRTFQTLAPRCAISRKGRRLCACAKHLLRHSAQKHIRIARLHTRAHHDEAAVVMRYLLIKHARDAVADRQNTRHACDADRDTKRR